MPCETEPQDPTSFDLNTDTGIASFIVPKNNLVCASVMKNELVFMNDKFATCVKEEVHNLGMIVGEKGLNVVWRSVWMWI